MDTKRIIEVNGMKLEVDLTQAKVVEQYKVGDCVKVLVKQYGNDYKSLPGVIIGFDNFKMLPTIVIVGLDLNYSQADLKFYYFNSLSKDLEICAANPKELFVDKQLILDKFRYDIERKEQEARDVIAKRQYFLEHFNHYFGESFPKEVLEKAEEVVSVE